MRKSVITRDDAVDRLQQIARLARRTREDLARLVAANTQAIADLKRTGRQA